MINQTKYTLKTQYKLGVIDNKNFIIGFTDYKCVFLNPLSAVMVNNIINCKNIDDAINETALILRKDKEEVEPIIFNIIKRLHKYIVVDEDSNNFLTHDELLRKNIEIIKRSKELINPFPQKPFPTKIKFYLTDYCSRQCVYCFAGAKKIKSDSKLNVFLSKERFKDIIIEADKIGVKNIEISGGDPFILDDIDDYLSIMIKYFHNPWATSTKTYVSKDRARELKEIGLKEIQISIDTFDYSNGDKMMGSINSTKELIESIDNLLSNGIKVNTKAVITSINIRDIPDMVKAQMEMGIKEIRLGTYYLSGNKKANYLIADKESRLWLDNKMKPLIEKAKNDNILLEYTCYDDEEVEDLDIRPFCGGFTEAMSVRYDGGVVFCDSLNHLDEFVAGNLKEQSIMEVWNSKKLKDFSNPAYFKEKYKGTKCEKCNIFDNCFYKRCYVRSFTEYGKYFDMDPACPFGPKDYKLVK